jgi:DNA-binding transcriptional MerR regulator
MYVPIEFLTQGEAASLLGLTDRTLRNWRRDGYGPKSFKHGSATLYRRSDIEAFRVGGSA